MATVRDIYNFIDKIAPFEGAEEWDNSGLLAGDESRTVKKAIFALDITSDVINQAAECGADLIVTHHPVIFKPVSSVTADTLVYKLIKNNLSIICAHTNYDKAVGGVNDILCRKIGFESFSKHEGTFFNIGVLKQETTLEDFVTNVKNALGGTVRYNGGTKTVKKVAVCSGSGSDYLETAHRMGCDALLTGDGGHHAFLDADEYKMALVCAGHFETEALAINPLSEKIRREFKIECVAAQQRTPIITV